MQSTAGGANLFGAQRASESAPASFLFFARPSNYASSSICDNTSLSAVASTCRNFFPCSPLAHGSCRRARASCSRDCEPLFVLEAEDNGSDSSPSLTATSKLFPPWRRDSCRSSSGREVVLVGRRLVRNRPLGCCYEKSENLRSRYTDTTSSFFISVPPLCTVRLICPFLSRPFHKLVYH